MLSHSVPHKAVSATKSRKGRFILYRSKQGEQKFAVNQSAIVVWDMIDGQQSVHELSKTLTREYPGAKRSIRNDLEHLLADLEQIGLIELAPAASLDSIQCDRQALAILYLPGTRAAVQAIAGLCRCSGIGLWMPLPGLQNSLDNTAIDIDPRDCTDIPIHVVESIAHGRSLFATGLLHAVIVSRSAQIPAIQRAFGNVAVIAGHEFDPQEIDEVYSYLPADPAAMESLAAPNQWMWNSYCADKQPSADDLSRLTAFVSRAGAETALQYPRKPLQLSGGEPADTADHPADRIFFYHPQADDLGLYDEEHAFVHGAQTSTLQAARRLQAAGYPCQIVDHADTPGIYLLHPDNYNSERLSNNKVFLVLIRNDRHSISRAQCEVVQNPTTANDLGDKPAFYIPYFPQQNLIPRNHAIRGEQLCNITYFGRRQNINAKLRSDSFRQWLLDRGMNLQLQFRPDQWHDYSQTDVLIAVRDFHRPWHQKPANKLVNAWRAEVPALLGPESSFQWYRRSELDYIETRSLEDVKKALLKLKNDPELVDRMRDNGRLRQQDVTFDIVTQCWAETLDHSIRPLARQWFDDQAR